MSSTAPSPAVLPDLASRAVGGSVVHANDELFAERENLIKPEEPVFQPHTFGHKGQVYDGWETRRRREPGHDYAIVRLGLPGAIRQLVVDTAFFKGNYPPEVSVQACAVEGYPSPDELMAAEWTEILPRTPVRGDARNTFDVDDDHRYTHVRLCLHPDGGVARLRVRGEPIADPRWLPARFDLAALENGGRIAGCSNMFYSSPTNLLLPGPARVMGEGWETARRRDDGNDWVSVQLAAPGIVHWAELDTSCFVGNAPGWAALSGCDTREHDPEDPQSWTELLPRTRLQPDTRHRFRLPVRAEVTRVRVDIYPDGGMARLRLHGEAAPEGHQQLVRSWFNALPEPQAREVLSGSGGTSAERVAELVASRPVTGALPAELIGLLPD
ncbi:allantoicase [Saccharopolyspora rectivirgula]|jgi:allantoicase|uniref:Probable allantoicase n=1 Tax=Saccharopolyspora rectivirgula TaxID=28042 RepID=A0A073BBN8_9PSEU|nr:allantoicase [Saccharopolyspora rectivirgula]KEI45144.1 allantoicase [Saccharopolyspora rectivirgula]